MGSATLSNVEVAASGAPILAVTTGGDREEVLPLADMGPAKLSDVDVAASGASISAVMTGGDREEVLPVADVGRVSSQSETFFFECRDATLASASNDILTNFCPLPS